jgi:hypothetical protein
MPKHNYQAWEIKAKDFSDEWSDIHKLKFFAEYAILAPSGHNTQPWHFKKNRDNLLLQADTSRSLPYSGLQANEPLVSLGSCLGILGLAAKGFGYNLSIKYTSEEGSVARITIKEKTSPDPSLLNAITSRVSNRSLYKEEKISKKDLEIISQNGYKNVSIHIISNKKDINYLAEKTAESTIKIMGDKTFRAELSKWVRNNVTRQHDGMPGFVQEIPTPPSMLAKHIIKNLNISKDQAKKDSNRMLATPCAILITVTNASSEALLNAGSLYARVCVLAAQHNIDTSGLGSAVVDPETKEAIVKTFKLPGQPMAIIRVGKATKAARHTPRWPLSSVIS